MPFPPVPKLYLTKDLNESASLIDINFKNIINYLERLKGSTRDTIEDIVMTSEAGIGILDINTLDPRHQFLTKVNDTNVTLAIASAVDTHVFSLGWLGTLAASRLNANVVQAVINDTNFTGSIAAQSLTLGFTGTLAAARLNASVVQAIVNDTNITGVIAAQVLTLGWTGTLAADRLNTNVVQAITNDTNITGVIAAQNLTLGFTGTLSGARGGTGVANTGFTITLAGSLVTTGAFSTTLVQGATVSLTLPLVSSTLLANNLGLASNTVLVGGTAASGSLTLQSTSHGTKGTIVLGTSAYDEVNNRLGILTVTPRYSLDIYTPGVLGFSDASGATYDSTLAHTVDSPYRILTALSLGGSGGWRGTLRFDVNYNAGASFTALAIQANTDGTTANVGIGTITPSTLLDVKGIISSLLGASTGVMPNIGVANVQTSSGGIGNATDTTDDTLFTYSLPLNAMSTDGKSLRSIATGHFATNANTKRVKFWFAGTAIADSAVLTVSNSDWECDIEVTRIDSTHASCRGRFTGSNVADVITITPNLVVADLTANASIVKITGASTVAAAANDVLGYLMKTWFEN